MGARAIEDHAIGTSEPLYESCLTLKKSTNKSVITLNRLIDVSTILHLREPCKADDSTCLLFLLYIIIIIIMFLEG
jgi:hypothetical protein